MIEISYIALLMIHLVIGVFTWYSILLYGITTHFNKHDLKNILRNFATWRPYRMLVLFLLLGIFGPAFYIGVCLGER